MVGVALVVPLVHPRHLGMLLLQLLNPDHRVLKLVFVARGLVHRIEEAVINGILKLSCALEHFEDPFTMVA